MDSRNLANNNRRCKGQSIAVKRKFRRLTDRPFKIS